MLDPETHSKRSTKGTLSNALQAALEACGGHDSTVIGVRLRGGSEIQSPLESPLGDNRSGIVMHAVLSAESPKLATFFRGYRGSMILLENDGEFIFGKVQKRVIDTSKE